MLIEMGRRKGYDNKKIVAIISALARNPDGLWLRKLAQDTNLSPATVSHYIDSILNPLIECVSLGDKKPFLKVIKLKPMVLQKIEEGQNINQILKTLYLFKRIK